MTVVLKDKQLYNIRTIAASKSGDFAVEDNFGNISYVHLEEIRIIRG